MIKAFKKYCILFILTSCVSTKSSMVLLDGIYRQDKNSNYLIILSGNSFSIVDPYQNDLALYTCCDTVSKGTWTRENDLLCLSTPQLKQSLLDLIVTELNDFKYDDSIVLVIKNPIEDNYKKIKITDRDIDYRVTLFNNNGSLLEGWTKLYNTNIIKIRHPRNIRIAKISVSAYPNARFNGRNTSIKEVSTIEYKIKDDNSNHFEVTIPELSYEYLSYLRLNRDFVKIISKTKLEWDGNFYIRE